MPAYSSLLGLIIGAVLGFAFSHFTRLTVSSLQIAAQIPVRPPAPVRPPELPRFAAASAEKAPSSASVSAARPGRVSPRRFDLTASRVLCWIPSRDSFGPAVDTIFQTWGRHCDELLFTSSTANASRNVLALSLPPLGQKSLWNIVHPGWRHMFETRLEKFDWFVKLDDDTYFSADNFKHVVRNLDPEAPAYLGHTSYHLDYPFNLGAGHAISRGTLRVLGPRLPGPDEAQDRKDFHCDRKLTWAEDWQFAKCLKKAGVATVVDSRDSLHRETFMAWLVSDNFLAVRRPDSNSWFWRDKPSNVGSGTTCCSPRPVLWHNFKVSDRQLKGMPELEYYLYHVRVDPIEDA